MKSTENVLKITKKKPKKKSTACVSWEFLTRTTRARGEGKASSALIKEEAPVEIGDV